MQALQKVLVWSKLIQFTGQDTCILLNSKELHFRSNILYFCAIGSNPDLTLDYYVPDRQI